MDSTLGAAGIAAIATLAAAYIGGLVPESYRRFHEGHAIAAGLAGKLASHDDALVVVRKMFLNIATFVDTGKRQEILLRTIDRPHDSLFF